MRDRPLPRSRSQARSRALQLLYLYDQGGGADMAEQFRRDQPARPQVESFARELVERVLAHQGELDDLIRAQAQHWDLERMAVVDRNVLRLGLCELLHFPQTPRQVAIDEAVELAKSFGGACSGAFVNGILDHVVLPASVEASVEASAGGFDPAQARDEPRLTSAGGAAPPRFSGGASEACDRRSDPAQARDKPRLTSLPEV